MKQINCPWMDKLFRAGQSCLIANPIVGIPICIGKAPKHVLISYGLRQSQAPFAESALRRTEKSHLILKGFFHLAVQFLDFLRALFRGNGDEVGMMGRVVSYHMSFINHPLHQFRLTFHIIHSYEKYSADLFLFKYIKDSTSIPIFISFVKGEMKIVAVLGSDEIRTILFVFLLHPYI